MFPYSLKIEYRLLSETMGKPFASKYTGCVPKLEAQLWVPK